MNMVYVVLLDKTSKSVINTPYALHGQIIHSPAATLVALFHWLAGVFITHNWKTDSAVRHTCTGDGGDLYGKAHHCPTDTDKHQKQNNSVSAYLHDRQSITYAPYYMTANSGMRCLFDISCLAA